MAHGFGQKQVMSAWQCSSEFITSNSNSVNSYELIFRGGPNFCYNFSYGAETASKMTFGLVSVSANMVAAKFLLRP